MQRIKEGRVHKKQVSLVRRWYKNVRVKVRVDDVESDWFNSNLGVRQGDTLSPLLSNMFINSIVETVKESGRGNKVGMDNVPALLFIDDMVLVANNEEELQHLVEKVNVYYDK